MEVGLDFINTLQQLVASNGSVLGNKILNLFPCQEFLRTTNYFPFYCQRYRFEYDISSNHIIYFVNAQYRYKENAH